MKHFYSSLLLCFGIGVTQSIGFAAPLDSLFPKNDKEERVYAPKDGFYLIETPEDCKLGKTYIFASSVFSLQDMILAQDPDVKEYIKGHNSNTYSKSAHIVNGSVIYEDEVALKYAIWRYENDEDKQKHLVNVDSNEQMAVWKKEKVFRNYRYNLFTVKKNINNQIKKKMSTAMSFEVTVPIDFKDKTCDSPQWFGLYFNDNGAGKDWVKWTNFAKEFKVYTSSNSEEHFDQREALINPTRIFRHFTKGELLPSTYVATKTINFSTPGYRTFYSQHAYTIPEGVKAYFAQLDNYTLNLYPIQKAIPACTAVLLYKESAGEVKLNLTFDEISPINDNNSLKGTRHELSEKEVEESRFNYYGLTVDDENPKDWYFARIESSIPVGKALLALKKNAKAKQAGVRKLNFVVHTPLPTAITPITPSPSPESSKHEMTIWDLQGRPLQQPIHGQPYIQNGKVKMGE